MFRKLLLLSALVLIMIAVTGRAAENGSPGAAFTSTTTHIEADVWGFLKIEVHERDVVPKPAKPPQARPENLAVTDMNFFGIVLGSRYDDELGRTRAWHDGVIEFPYIFSCHYDRRKATRLPHGYAGDYWIALYDAAAEMDYEKRNDAGGYVKYSRMVILDAPLGVALFKARFDAPRRAYWEVLDLPLCTTASHLTDGDKETWKVLNVPLVWVYRSERNGGSISRHLLDVPLANFYESHRSGAGHGDWRFLDVPLATVAKGGHDGGAGHFKLLDLPLVSLWQTSHDGKGNSRGSLLDLPLVGPLFSWRHEASGFHAGVFSGIFSDDE